MSGLILGADGKEVFSQDQVEALLEQQARKMMQDEFKGLYFALIQLGFSERIKAHKSWAENTATGLADQAHQTVSAAFERLGREGRARQAAMDKEMAAMKKREEEEAARRRAGTTQEEAPHVHGPDCGHDHASQAEEPAKEAT